MLVKNDWGYCSLFALYCKRWKDGQGLGTRLGQLLSISVLLGLSESCNFH